MRTTIEFSERKTNDIRNLMCVGQSIKEGNEKCKKIFVFENKLCEKEDGKPTRNR